MSEQTEVLGNHTIGHPPAEPMPVDGKIKTSEGKVDFTLLPLDVVGALNVPLAFYAGCARAFEYGASKYQRGNYLKAEANEATWIRYISAALRHYAAGDGSTRDVPELDESGLPHWCHEQASLLMLITIWLRAKPEMYEDFEADMQADHDLPPLTHYLFALDYTYPDYLGRRLRESLRQHQGETPTRVTKEVRHG